VIAVFGLLLVFGAGGLAVYLARGVLGDLGIPIPGFAWQSQGGLLREGSTGIAGPIARRAATSSAKVTLSSDQQLVKEVFGRPPAFRVVFGQDPSSKKPTRVENWIYPRQGASFVFRDGKYADSVDMPRAPAPLRAAVARPEDFAEGSSFAQIRKIHGRQPLFQIDIPGAGGQVTAFHFDTGLIVGFDRATGKLRFVEQLAERSRR
jgi:hypothetical protein